jgi:inner membrane protein
VDPVTHTLFGIALAETGLKERTALGGATLVVGANLPDIDVLAYAWGPTTALWFRRGATHGVVALVVLPLVLTGIMLAWDRLVRRPSVWPVVGRQVWLLAAIAVASHPVLDFLNVYGMRWLMPFSDRWTYGDTLFIVDPWVWAILFAGIFLARRQRGSLGTSRRRPALGALVMMGVYIGVLAMSNVAARRIVTRSLVEAGMARPTRLMVAPMPVNPLRRRVVVEDAGLFRFGFFRWLPSPSFELEEFTYDRHPASPAAAAATRGPKVRQFLSWARFPYSQVEERPDRYLVRLGDARYTLEPAGWAGMLVEIEK